MISNLSSELFPSPREILERSGHFTEPDEWLAFGNDSIIAEISHVSPFALRQSDKDCAHILLNQSQLDEEAFIIECKSSKISIFFGSSRGALYALKTFKQMLHMIAMILMMGFTQIQIKKQVKHMK